MKKKLIATAMLCSAATASASTLFYEPFDYPTATVGASINTLSPASVSPNAWTKGGATNDPVLSSNNTLSYSGLPASQGTSAAIGGAGNTSNTSVDRIQFSSTALATNASPILYYSMLIQVPTGVTNFGASNNGSFFAGFNYNPDVSPLNDASTGAAGALCIRKDATGTGYNLGIAYRDAGVRVFNSAILAPGTTVFAVVKYNSGSTVAVDAHDDSASIWFNPAAASLGGASEPGPADNTSTNTTTTVNDYYYNPTGDAQLGSGIKSFELRDNASEPTNINVDEIRVGTSWADVTSDVAPSPEPASLGLLGIAGCGALARRRRQV